MCIRNVVIYKNIGKLSEDCANDKQYINISMYRHMRQKTIQSSSTFLIIRLKFAFLDEKTNANF